MATLSDLELKVYDRLEEDRSNPRFWTPLEARAALIEMLNEAALLTGQTEARRGSPTVIAPNTTVFTIPSDLVAITNMEGPSGAIPKTFVDDLDDMVPAWENDTGSSIRFWFPIGLSQFGVYPKVTDEVRVVLSGIILPVSSGLPYTGAETVPFQVEFHEAFEEGAAHVLKVKEGGQELLNSLKNYDRFLGKCGELSKFGDRKSPLRFSVSRGGAAKVTVVESR